MAPRQIKMPVKKDAEKEAEDVSAQSKRPEIGRYLLQVDRQTKGSLQNIGSGSISGAGNQDELSHR